MMKGFKIKLYPTKEQEEKFWQNFGLARFAYNWSLEQRIKARENEEKYPSNFALMYEMKLLSEKEEYSWIKSSDITVYRGAIMDCNVAYEKFFSKQNKFPKFKSKHKSKKMFYTRNDRIRFNESQVRMIKIGWVKTSSQKHIPKGDIVYNPRVSFDGVSYWLSFTKDIEKPINNKPKTEPIGIDMGIKTLMTCSNGMNFNTVNVRKEENKLKRLQRKASKIYDFMYKNSVEEKSNNLKKLEIKIKKKYQHIANIRENNINQCIAILIKENPSHICIEDLNVIQMMKNKYLSSKVANACFHKIKSKLQFKCEWNDIKLILADRYYPSSKICSHCGSVKKQLSLSERTYVCEYCGTKIDRDYNASLNLKNLAYSH